MKLNVVLVLVLALAGIPAAAREVCAGFAQPSRGCCCQTDKAGNGSDGMTAHCGCAMNGAPEQAPASEAPASTTERAQSSHTPAASTAAAGSVLTVTQATTAPDWGAVFDVSPSCITLCTFRC